METERKCEDCGKPATVGLNGSWVCLIDFNNRLIQERERMEKLRRTFQTRPRP